MEFLLVNRKHNKYSSCHPSGNRQGCTAVLSILLRCRLRSYLPVLVAAGLDCVFLQDRLHKKEQHRFCFINLFLLSKPQLVSTWNFKIPAIRCSTCQDTRKLDSLGCNEHTQTHKCWSPWQQQNKQTRINLMWRRFFTAKKSHLHQASFVP